MIPVRIQSNPEPWTDAPIKCNCEWKSSKFYTSIISITRMIHLPNSSDLNSGRAAPEPDSHAQKSDSMSLAYVSFLVMRHPTKCLRIPPQKCSTYSEHESVARTRHVARPQATRSSDHRCPRSSIYVRHDGVEEYTPLNSVSKVSTVLRCTQIYLCSVITVTYPLSTGST